MKHHRCFFKILAIALPTALLAGCASTARDSAIPSPRSLKTGFTALETAVGSPANMSVPDVLELPDALALALDGNPELTAFSHEIRTAEAETLQAGLLPNPALELGVDEYNRDGAGFDSAETAIMLGQLFELGGKRRWRKRIAETEGELAGWDYESKRLDIFAETAQRFNAVLVAQERFDLLRSTVELAEKANRAVKERVLAGKEPPLQLSKSEAELEMAHLDALEAEDALAVARQKLASMWGARQADFTNVSGKLNWVVQAVPTLDALRMHLGKNPELARRETELRLLQSKLSAEKAARIPDLEGAVGYVQYEEDGTDAVAVAIGMPLPLFNRNQGNIAAASHNLEKTKAAQTATEIEMTADLTEVHAALRIAHQRVSTLRGKVIPAMEQAFQAAHEGYTQGKFGFLDMLDAQRTLFAAKAALLEARSGYQSALIETQRLTGTDIEALMNENEEE